MALPHRTVRLDLGITVLSSVATLVVGFLAAVANGVFYPFQRVFYPFRRAVELLESVALLVLVAVGRRRSTLEFRWSERSVRVQSPGRFERR